MPALAVAEPVAFAPIRRFQLPDLSKHGAWILPRLLQAYPHLSERSAASWLQTILYNNDFCFLYHEHGVALAQLVSANALTAKPLIQEIFAWAEDRENKAQIEAVAEFYIEFHRWAQNCGATTIIVEEMSDVPHDLIKEKLGRIFTRQQQFARV